MTLDDRIAEIANKAMPGDAKGVVNSIAARVASLDPSSVIAISALIFAAFFLKLGLFPFHFWLPAVYVGSHPPIAAILSAALMLDLLGEGDAAERIRKACAATTDLTASTPEIGDAVASRV